MISHKERERPPRSRSFVARESLGVAQNALYPPGVTSFLSRIQNVKARVEQSASSKRSLAPLLPRL